uniref:Uncharacterized protein n=1 Tax=Melopsittacus undulatus TaxID=13146 RepID=A0A8V5G1T3_MELUD
GLGALLCADLRLVGGGGRCAGRVEVKHEGEWGSVCSYDFDWDAHWATVVCRQLGCGTAATSSPYAPFGQGTGRIWLHIFFCRGQEETLQDCPHFGWGQHYCGHEQDVGVTCTGEPGQAGGLRLVEGSGPCAGKVEVKLRGQWGAVADDTWTMEDAEVICQQLGCGSATKAYIDGSRTGSDDGPVNVVLVNCRGHEKAFWECEVRGWGPYSALHDFDTGVVCQGFSRLVGGDGSCSGLLQVRQGRAWTSVCEDGVDLNAARVVCRELGCGSVLAVAGPGLFPMGSEPQWDTGFECTGTELLLSACKRRARSTQGCSGQASIICSSYGGFRLVNHSSHCAGRVEVMEGGTWGSLCASAWDLPDAHVLCHHLGCGSASSVPPGGSFGSGNGTLRVDAFGCSGTERVPSECPVVGLGDGCRSGGGAGAVCSGQCRAPASGGGVRAPGAAVGPVLCAPVSAVHPHGRGGGARTRSRALSPSLSPPGHLSLRLTGGSGRCRGHLELLHNGTWGRVCADGTSPATAAAACRQLGCGDGGSLGAAPAPLPAPAWLAWVRCPDGARSLWLCPSAPWRLQPCAPGGDAHVVCAEDGAEDALTPAPGSSCPHGGACTGSYGAEPCAGPAAMRVPVSPAPVSP